MISSSSLLSPLRGARRPLHELPRRFRAPLTLVRARGGRRFSANDLGPSARESLRESAWGVRVGRFIEEFRKIAVISNRTHNILTHRQSVQTEGARKEEERRRRSEFRQTCCRTSWGKRRFVPRTSLKQNATTTYRVMKPPLPGAASRVETPGRDWSKPDPVLTTQRRECELALGPQRQLS